MKPWMIKMFVFCDPVLPSSAPVCALGHLPLGEGFFAKQQFILLKHKHKHALPVAERVCYLLLLGRCSEYCFREDSLLSDSDMKAFSFSSKS